jgi:hypothetical protein
VETKLLKCPTREKPILFAGREGKVEIVGALEL